MTLRTDRGAALAQLGEIFYGGVFLSKYNSLEKFHLVTANFLEHLLHPLILRLLVLRAPADFEAQSSLL